MQHSEEYTAVAKVEYASPMICIETTQGCGNTPRVLFALEETATPYRIEVRPDGHFLETYAAPGPRFVEDDFALMEGNAILRYIARTCGGGALLPADARGQAQVDRWLDGSLRLVLGALTGDQRFLVPGLKALNDEVAGRDWICGDFSIADCCLSALVLMSARLPLEPFANLNAYLARLTARPAWTRALSRGVKPSGA